MPEYPFDPVEAFWDALLSGDPRQIHSVYDPLDETTRQAVLAHLVRMVSEPGWHAQQVKNARAALVEVRGVAFSESAGTGDTLSTPPGTPAPKAGRKRHPSRPRGR